MATEMITLKLEPTLLKDIDHIVKESRYQSRTEFIRYALRDKVDEAKIKEAMQKIAHLKGIFKGEKQTTDEELHKIREKAFEEICKKFK